MNFVYHGDSHSIDVNTLISSQMHFVKLINEVSRLTNSSVELKIKIEATRPGSFELSQLFEVVMVSGLFAAPHTDYIANIFSIISDYLSIKQFLQGSRADSVEENNKHITINFNGDNIQVHPKAFEIYMNSYAIQESAVNLGKTLLGDQEVDGIELINDSTNSQYLNIPRERFLDLGESNAYLEQDIREEIDQKALLVITKPELNPKKSSSWNFIYKGRPIKRVIIRDNEFLKSVAAGLRFGNGDALIVELKIVLKYDPVYDVFVESRFEVLLVKDIRYRGQQTDFGSAEEQV